MNIALIHSGVAGTEDGYRDDGRHRYRIERIHRAWQPCFDGDDVVLVPNGANHVALLSARERLQAFVARGGALLCFCGFFTPWVPGYLWRHDYRRPLRDLRYHIDQDPLQLCDGVEAERLCVDAHGLRGGWACGEIVGAEGEVLHDHVVLRDNHGRALMVADRDTRAGLVIATASGPLSDDNPDAADDQGARRLYRNILRACRAHHEARHGG